MITRAMIKATEVDNTDSPFPGLKRYRAGVTFWAEQMVSEQLPESTHELAKERLRVEVWNHIYFQLWIKIQRMETLVAQRRWSDIEIVRKELDDMIRASFEQNKLAEWIEPVKE